MSTWPNLATVVSSKPSSDARSSTSAQARKERLPSASIFFAVASTISARRALGITSAPASASPRAIVWPIPDVPPTTTAVLPLKSKPGYAIFLRCKSALDLGSEPADRRQAACPEPRWLRHQPAGNNWTKERVARLWAFSAYFLAVNLLRSRTENRRLPHGPPPHPVNPMAG